MHPQHSLPELQLNLNLLQPALLNAPKNGIEYSLEHAHNSDALKHTPPVPKHLCVEEHELLPSGPQMFPIGGARTLASGLQHGLHHGPYESESSPVV